MLSTLLLTVATGLTPWIAPAIDDLDRFEAQLTALEGSAPAQWRVVWTESPATEATVSWTTAAECAENSVYFDTVARRGSLEDYPGHVAAGRNGRYTQDPDEEEPDAWYHHAALRDLKPSTTYYFVMVSGDRVSRELHFRTAPEGDDDFSLLYGGDSRTGHLQRCRVNRMIAELAAENEDLIAFLHGGDFVMYGSHWAHWRAWLSHSELTVGPSGRILPIVPTRGNHDFGPLFDEIFNAPGGEELNYFATQFSDQTALLTLNTNISAGGEQRDWLDSFLAALRPSVRWLMVQYHAPLFPAVKMPASAKVHWVPLFEKYDVDLSMESDGHCIKRTVPIRNERFDETGVVYIGEGGLGVPQREPRADHWYLKPPGLVAKGHHVSLLEFAPDGLRIRYFLLPEGSFDASGYQSVVSAGSAWRFLAGSDPRDEWSDPGFDDSSWRLGSAGFGYGGGGEQTTLADMRKSYTRVYIRREMETEVLLKMDTLGLVIDYDDAFIAYINGHEVCRQGIDAGRGAEVKKTETHLSTGYEYFLLEDWKEHLRPDGNVFAIEGHNRSRIGRTFLLDPFLIGDPLAEPGPAKEREAFDDHTLAPR